MFYAERFGTVEVNMTFYRLPTSRTVRKWYDLTPPDFVFSAKMNRGITHYRKLQDSDKLVRSFLDVMNGLEEKLGPILMQLPPELGPDLGLLETFLASLPPLQYAVEFRDRDWLQPATLRLLERYGVALVLTDPPPPDHLAATADFAYVRWHGRGGASYEYTERELNDWAAALRDLSVDEVYGYFNNDQGGAAPRNAAALSSLLQEHKVVAL